MIGFRLDFIQMITVKIYRCRILTWYVFDRLWWRHVTKKHNCGFHSYGSLESHLNSFLIHFFQRLQIKHIMSFCYKDLICISVENQRTRKATNCLLMGLWVDSCRVSADRRERDAAVTLIMLLLLFFRKLGWRIWTTSCGRGDEKLR